MRSRFAARFVSVVVEFGASDAVLPLITFVAGDVERIVAVSRRCNPNAPLFVMSFHAISAVAWLPLANTPVFELRLMPLL